LASFCGAARGNQDFCGGFVGETQTIDDGANILQSKQATDNVG
jgi:hypothetical protein